MHPLYLKKQFDFQFPYTTAPLEKTLHPLTANEGDYINEYDFDNYSVPFAYRMEPLYKFNG